MAPSSRFSPVTAFALGVSFGRARLWVCLTSALFLGTWTGVTATGATASSKTDPDVIIAGYLVNFVRYVEWPAEVPPAGQPWRIGLLDSDGLRAALERIVAGKSVRGRPIVVSPGSSPSDLRNCQVILLPSSSQQALSDAKAFAKLPVLTVIYRENEDAETEAAIELVLKNRNIRYRLNSTLFAAQGLRATPGLLENALPAVRPIAAGTP
jgi:hypothetical protein